MNNDPTNQLAPVPVFNELITEFAALPPGWTIQDLDRMRPSPRRDTGKITLTDIDDFAEIVKEETGPQDPSRIFFNPTTHQFTAVLNWADWRDYTAVLECPHSNEFLAWFRAGTIWMNQEGFIDFVMDQRADIVYPDAATLLEFVGDLESKIEATVRTIKRGGGETKAEFSEQTTVQGRTKDGVVPIPSSLKIRVKIFDADESLTTIITELRVKVEDHKIVFSPWMQEVEAKTEFQAEMLISRVKKATELKVYRGSISK